MKILPFLLASSFAFSTEVQLEKEALHQIGLKVWQNECRGTVDGLICWTAGEDFPSLGLGHFIWYPEGVEKKFDETFPALIAFLSEKLKDTDQKIPSWIQSKKGFPWKTREAFLKDKRSKKMQQLRDLLSSTLDLQIAFLEKRFTEGTESLSGHLSEKEVAHLEAMKKSSEGLYALIDYVNFKGTGLKATERYRSEGWGLLQVLQNIPSETKEEAIVAAFATSAKKVLTRRVRNAPIHKKEDRFLAGWYKRIETYTQK
jgi:hypothetical protein